MRQLPTEARRFNSVDQLWKKVCTALAIQLNRTTHIQAPKEKAVARAKYWSFGVFLQVTQYVRQVLEKHDGQQSLGSAARPVS